MMTVSDLLLQARSLYDRFQGHRPRRNARVPFRRIVPPVVVELGDLLGLIYRSDRGGSGRSRTFVHFMDDPPRLVTEPSGRQLYVIGGSYLVTPRGIEG